MERVMAQMIKKYLDENIFYIENVIDKKDLDLINNFYDQNKNYFFRSGNFFNFNENKVLEKDFKNDKEYKSFKDSVNEIKKINKKMEDILINNIDIEYHHPHFNYGLMQYYNQEINNDGWAIPLHSDKYTYSEDKNVDSHNSPDSFYVVSGYIFYFNDDYTGGEVFYDKKNITFRPKSGMLLIHSGQDEYSHGVNYVDSGERRFASGFTFENNFCVKKQECPTIKAIIKNKSKNPN